jgi:two-component system, NtrC family, sensor kinase
MEPTRRMLARVRPGLAWRLAGFLVASTAGILFISGTWNLRLQRKSSEDQLMGSAERVADIIRRSTQYQMMNNDREALYQTIRDIGSEPGIRRVRIFNKEGRITFSTDPAEVNATVNKQAEACYACHAQSAPLEHLNRPDRARIFTDSGSKRVLGVILPIYNSVECANAACHAHPATRKILGVIDSQMLLDQVDSQVEAQQRRGIFSTGLTLLAICALTLLWVWHVLHRPIHALMAGTHRVADGDLAYRLKVTTQDELGDLARSFNKMTAQLAAAQEEIMAWARTLEDRAERKGRELERAYSSLLASEKMASLGKLAATVAHEVNNPLMGILTYARLSLKDLDKMAADPKAATRVREQLGIIERESRRCGDIMKNLLTFARQAPSQRAPNQVNELVKRATQLVRHQLELKSIELESNLAADMPAVPCDTGQVQQVILILVVNACEALQPGGQIWVSTEFDAATDEARIRVRDNGPGIAPEAAAKIFEPFFTTKEDQHRTGLGLAVAKSILEQHGGSIEVRSTPGEGAEFVVSLPLEAGASAASPSATAASGARRES